MKKIILFATLIVMLLFLSINASAYNGYSFNCGLKFGGVRDLPLGTTLTGDFKKSPDVYRFVLEKPTKLKISIDFNRRSDYKSDFNVLTYFVSDSSLSAFLPGGELAFCRTSDYQYSGCITSGIFRYNQNELSRSHYIGVPPNNNHLFNKGYYTGPADLLPAGTYYLSLNYTVGDERDTYTVTIDCIHESTTEKIVTEPTCSKAGKKEIICDGCGKVADTETIKKLAHTPADEWVITDATCSKEGKKELFCTVCNEVAKKETIDKLPHTYGEWTIDKETSCKAAGEKSRVCSVCSDKEEEEIAALPHTYGEWVMDKEATCSATGERSRVCSVCEYKEKEKLDKLAHTFGEWEITTQATCSSKGKQKHTCTVCGKSETESIAALEHDFAKWEVTTKATCTSAGKETCKCKNCSKTETRTVEKLGHYCDEWDYIMEEATCTSTGRARGYCVLCGERITEELPMLDHDFGEWTVTAEATCTKNGKKTATCAECGETETKKISKIDHDYGEWEVTAEPTCTKVGKQERSCKVCGRAETKAVDKAAHIVEEWAITKEATDTRKGTRKGKCTVCGKSVTENYEKYPGRDGFKKSRDYGSKFSDVGNDKWFRPYVETAYEYELTNGTSNTRFSPDNKFTVAQALTAAANIHSAYYGYEIDISGTHAKWYTPYVNYCIENEIITQTQFTDYEKNITRGEMAIVFANILPTDEYTSVRTGAPSDMKSSMPSYNAVSKLYRAGIVSGDAATGNYRPDDEIVRSEACVIFTRIAVDSYRAK